MYVAWKLAYLCETGIDKVRGRVVGESLLVEGRLELLEGQGQVEDVRVGVGRGLAGAGAAARARGLVAVLAPAQLSWSGHDDGGGGHNGGEGKSVLHDGSGGMLVLDRVRFLERG